MKATLHLTVISLLLAVSNLSAGTLYVSPQSTKPTPPFASWATAATNIQDAVDAAAAGDEVVVSNGVYSVGMMDVGNGRSRVAITNAVALLSVNGPQFTVIDGGGVVRCASLSDGASLSGFTLANGAAYNGNGGGVWCSSTNTCLTNCTLMGNSAVAGMALSGWGAGGGAFGGTLYNCTLTGNSGGGKYPSGGGAFGSTLYNCTLSDNRVADLSGGRCGGGGAVRCTLYNCTLTGNSAEYGEGGGAERCALYGCTLIGNSAYYGPGGGACISTLYNCTLSGNSASGGGGGVCDGTLYNCILTDNSTSDMYGIGGGAVVATLYNCTLTGNSANGAYGDCGGAYRCNLTNCILFYNRPNNYREEPGRWGFGYCCTTPLPTNGVGNITNAPLIVDYPNSNVRLKSNSPCINAGNNAYATTAADLDGSPRIVSGTVDIGAYEYQGTGSVISYAWLQQYGLPTDGSADFIDSDNDGMNNWQEWVCGTDPTNALSALRLLSAVPAGTNATVTWQSMAGVNYFLERSTNLATPLTLLATNILGQAGTTSYADTNIADTGPFFYRLGVQSP